jgi:hypothetical protein
MIFTNLDTIVNLTLLERRLPKHWYIEFLVHCSSCLRELNIDTLKIINSATLIPNAAGQANLPCDYMAECGIFITYGQYLAPMVHRNNITPLVNYNQTGQPIPYGGPLDNPLNNFLPGNWPVNSWFWNIDDFGESLGRMFGTDTTLFNPNGYQIFEKRRQVQFTETNTRGSYVLLYISDGQTIDNASQITPMAINALQAWTDWKRSKNAANPKSPEGFGYFNAKRNLRSRLSDIESLEDIKQIIRANYQDAPKT